jgi:GNAT superfamily N-acetyltransferase
LAGFANTIRRASEAIEDFRGDYDQLAAVMLASWGQGPDPPYLCTAEFMADCFRYPGSSFSLAPTLYHESELVAFAAGFPRRVLLAGVERRILISAFLTVAPEHKASGYGIVVWSELLRRAKDAGFDGVVSYCVEGGDMNRMVPMSCRLLELPVIRAASFSHLTSSLWELAAARGDRRGCADVPRLTKAAARMAQRAELARLWTEEEAAWQLSRRGAVSASSGSDADPGVLTGYVIPLADAVETKCLVIDDVLWGDLAEDGRTALVADLVTSAVSAGARIAIVARVGYADTQAFLSAGFVPSQHTVNSYLTTLAGAGIDRPPERYYLDVI